MAVRYTALVGWASAFAGMISGAFVLLIVAGFALLTAGAIATTQPAPGGWTTETPYGKVLWAVGLLAPGCMAIVIGLFSI